MPEFSYGCESWKRRDRVVKLFDRIILFLEENVYVTG
jgi:hypothetical protein